MTGIYSLSDVPIGVWQPDGRVKVYSILDSPYFRTLHENSRQPYDSYTLRLDLLGIVHSKLDWSSFLELRNNIAISGWKPEKGPAIFLSNEIGQKDGHHRLAILAHLFGVDAQVELQEGRLIFSEPTAIHFSERRR